MPATQTPLQFTTITGKRLGTAQVLESMASNTKPKRKKPEDIAGSHNGWRVQGIPPGAMAEAQRLAKLNLVVWNEENWLMNAKRMPVRSKPYAVPDAAQQCKVLAEKSGWLRVEIVELKREAAGRGEVMQRALAGA